MPIEEKLIQRLESAVTRLEALSATCFHSVGSAGTGGDAAVLDPPIIAFDDLRSQFLGKVSSIAEKIGGPVLDITKVVEEAFSAQRELLIIMKETKKSDTSVVVELLKPLNDVITKASKMTEGRRSDYFNQLKSAADSLSALSWISYTGKDCDMSMPIAHVEESWQMAEFYNNKILVEFKSKDPNHVEWAKALKALYLPGLRDYVKSHYPLGPVWNATGKTAVFAPSKASTPGAPAPPAPPPASLCCSNSRRASSSRPKKGIFASLSRPGLGIGAVVAEIKSKKSVTSGLRKVTDDMKTKNRADRTGIVNAGEKEVCTSSPSVFKTGPPKLELVMGRKWVVENQIGQKNLAIDDCDAKQSVYIYGCKDSVLQIKGKVNNITVDKCTKMGVVFSDVVAAFEVVNCNGLEMQCQGSTPTISVDNTNDCQLYLSKDSLEAGITTAKSSAINVMIPGTGPNDDWGEHALPQQYAHVYKDGHFVTTPVSHSGA